MGTTIKEKTKDKGIGRVARMLESLDRAIPILVACPGSPFPALVSQPGDTCGRRAITVEDWEDKRKARIPELGKDDQAFLFEEEEDASPCAPRPLTGGEQRDLLEHEAATRRLSACPNLVAQPGDTVGRREAKRKARALGLGMAARNPEGFRLRCPLEGDLELTKEWEAGAATEGAARAFQAGKDFGLFGTPCIRPSGEPLAGLWEEGLNEGQSVAKESSPGELSYGRGFRAGLYEVRTERGPVFEEWRQGYLVGSGMRTVSVRKEDPASWPEELAKEERRKARLAKVAGAGNKEVLMERCPFGEGTASRLLYEAVATAGPLPIGEAAERAGLPEEMARSLLTQYRGRWYSAPLRRAGVAFVLEKGLHSLVTREPEPNAKRPLKRGKGRRDGETPTARAGRQGSGQEVLVKPEADITEGR